MLHKKNKLLTLMLGRWAHRETLLWSMDVRVHVYSSNQAREST